MMPTADAAAAPPKKKKNVVLGMLGVTRDCPRLDRRWQMWRPTVGVCWQPGFAVDRLDLIHDAKHEAGAERVERDIAKVAEGTQVARHVIDFDDPWDFEEVYEKLYDFARAYPFRPEREDYFIHITTGTHVAQICLFLLAEARYLPGRLIQSAPDPAGENGVVEVRHAIIDLGNLSRYDRLVSRFAMEQRDTQDFLQGGDRDEEPGVQRLDRRDRTSRRALARRSCWASPTGAGKTQLARRIYELKRARQGWRGCFVGSTARRCAAMPPCPRSSSTRRAPSPAR
ncbi:MAG: RNA repair transcriptional activator RtcR family protein [Verrucomicrobiales bacterium]